MPCVPPGSTTSKSTRASGWASDGDGDGDRDRDSGGSGGAVLVVALRFLPRSSAVDDAAGVLLAVADEREEAEVVVVAAAPTSKSACRTVPPGDGSPMAVPACRYVVGFVGQFFYGESWGAKLMRIDDSLIEITNRCRRPLPTTPTTHD